MIEGGVVVLRDITSIKRETQRVELLSNVVEVTADAVIDALRTCIAQERTARRSTSLADRLDAIAERCRRLPVLDERSEDDILGYDATGLPT